MMKLSALVCLVGSASGARHPIIGGASGLFQDAAPVVSADLIDRVNGGNASWTAGENERFAGTTLAEAKRLMGTDMEAHQASLGAMQKGEAAAAGDIPDAFDARTKWQSCIHPIRDQGQCGSCWAFAAAESASDRLCIASDGKTDVILSPQNLVSCDWEGNQGCNGGIPHLAWDYIEFKGLPSDSCQPYHSGTTKDTGSCLGAKCESDSDTFSTYKSKLLSASHYSSVAAIQTAIMTDGPAEAAFTVYNDFMTYKSGVYSHQTGAQLGGHAVKIVGWGTDAVSGKDYWIVANSWSETWGLEGYFWIERGTNECGIESGVVAGMMKV